MARQTIRVGILGHQFISWGGGVDFLRLICGSLAATQSVIDIHVFFPVRGPLNKINSVKWSLKRFGFLLLGRRSGFIDTPNLKQIQQLLLAAAGSVSFHQIDIGGFSLRKACRELNVDVLLPSFLPLSIEQEVPWIGYLYDMQHKHLPHLFSVQEIKRRNFEFKNMVDRAPLILVNSKSVVKDLIDSFPDASEKIFSLPFSPAPAYDWFEVDGVACMAKYGVCNRYFIICNQFWKHKDHSTAIKAFSLFAKKHKGVELICTGATYDYRDPAYFENIKELISDLKIQDKVRILGLIPKADQIALMRGALALIQPTLFEGGPGGGAVYDAVGLGVPCIVSDIDVNMEIEDDEVCFFKSRDADDLFRAMDSVYQNNFDRGRNSSIDLLARGQRRWQLCGEVLLNSIQKLLTMSAR